MLIADDDFLEHLHEQGFITIELEELYIEWQDWCTENVDFSKNVEQFSCNCWCYGCIQGTCCERGYMHILKDVPFHNRKVLENK